MNLPWNRPKQADPLRGIVLGNLTRLQRLFHARGRRFSFDRDATTAKLEAGLWNALDSTANDLRLSFAPSTPCETRISEITRNLPPLARPGSRQASQWPSFLQTAR